MQMHTLEHLSFVLVMLRVFAFRCELSYGETSNGILNFENGILNLRMLIVVGLRDFLLRWYPYRVKITNS